MKYSSNRALRLHCWRGARSMALLCTSLLASLLLATDTHAQFSREASRERSYDSAVTGAAPMRFAPPRDGSPYDVQRIDENSLVVYRVRGGAAGLEGFVLDTPALIRHLEARVLEQRGLGSVARVALANGPTVRERVGAFSYPYSFAAPFNALSLRLSLGPLDDGNEPTWIALFACALALFMLAGLYALYRMVAVQLHFAERRENFVSAVSHELKTPLTAIRMYGELLRDDLIANDATRRDYYALITTESERLSRLVDNILKLAQIERAEPQSPRSLQAPGAIVRAALELLEPRAKELGFELCAEIAEPLPAVALDGDSLTQIVFNLLDNAFKYARDASDRRVDVSCRAVASGVALSVRDRGPGVAGEDLAHVFEPFFRSGSELVRRHQGVGLGLALVKGLVEQMHGRIECHNAQPGFEVRVLLHKPR